MSQRPINTTTNAHKISGIKHIIAVGSGKGGVGKSTVALNLALALQAQGMRIGLLDADIYGPNQAHLLHSKVQAEVIDNRYQPVLAYGLQTMSMAYLIEVDSPMIWRGPMVSKAFQQMLFLTAWDNCDTLIIDLPPGTGDIPLTLTKKAPLTAAVIVTTPQTLATADAEKGIAMFKKLEVPILGIIENMSYHSCGKCGHQEHIFGSDGATLLAQKTNIELLGQLPLSSDIRQTSDNGQPIVYQYPDHHISKTLLDIGTQIKTKLDLHFPSNRSTFPDIVIE